MFQNLSRSLFSLGLILSIAAALPAQTPKFVQRVDIVHMTHTDVGFTDHPLVCREQQKRYLDIAIDSVLADPQFRWTAETTLAVADWWRDAAPERREDLLRAIQTGRLEIAALAMNQTATLDARQWHTMLHWLPEDLWQQAKPRVGIQNDVNGCPRAGAMAMLDRDVPYLFMGINATNGGPPFRTPSAFWWKMPDGRRIFVWLGDHYAQGFYYFHGASWRRGPVPESTDTRYRPARPGDFFLSDEDSVRAAHAHLLGRVAGLEAAGYDYPSLILSVTNEWRMDNDPPFPAIARFVETWNRLELKPELHLSSAGDALDRLQTQVGDRLPEHEGEWTDWWVNGCASGPREVAASRRAKRLLAAALSPVWGPTDRGAERSADAILRDLCMFDEHTWGSADSISMPHAIDTWAQYNEKSRAAYKPLAMSKLLLSQRVRTALYPTAEPGLHVANTAPAPFTGWVTMPATCLRGDWHSLADAQTGKTIPLEFIAGYAQFGRAGVPEQFSAECDSETFPDNVEGQLVRFWVDNLPAQSVTRFIPSGETLPPVEIVESSGPKLKLDDQGWPVEAIWPGMENPLFAGSVGDFVCVKLTGFSARWEFGSVLMSGDAARREAAIEQTSAEPAGAATVEQTPHSIVFEQKMTHPRLKWLVRRLELDRDRPKAQLTVRLYRISSELPEVFFIGCDVPAEGLPTASCGGVPFTPFTDQLPGTCRDYFAVDGWLDYAGNDGHRLWVTRDAPLVSLGGPQTLKNLQTPPDRPGRVYAMVFDNTWLTNFLADSHGQLEFRFDLLHLPGGEEQTAETIAAAAESLVSEPVVLIQSELPAEKVFSERLDRP